LLELVFAMKSVSVACGREARSRFGHNKPLPVRGAIKTFGTKKMFCTIRARRDGRRLGRIAAAGFLALAASAHASQAQQQDSILKQGAKLLGFAADVEPPADFVVKSRPAGDLDFIPVFQPLPEPARPALKAPDLKALKGDLDVLQKQHDALRQAYPPAVKAMAEEAAAKKKPKTDPVNAPNAQQ
jgi:hypothetical protein